MRKVSSIGRAAAVAAVIVCASSVTHASFAQGTQGNNTEHSQDTQGNQGSRGSQGAQGNQGTNDTQGSADTTAAQAVTAMLTVQKIDKANHMLTLKSAENQTFEAKAGPDVDLNRLHVGDSVEATYYEEIAIAINPSGKTPPKTTTTTVQREGVTAKQATLTARIVSVDADKKKVTLRDSQGRMHTVKVEDADIQARLGRIKPGDTVDLTYTQAVVMSVMPQQPQK